MMRNTALIGLLLFSSQALGQTVAVAPTLDGESSLPVWTSSSYRFKCADGVISMTVVRERGEAPVLSKLDYSGRSLLRAAIGPINDYFKQLRNLESVSPRCVTGGGAQLLLAGLRRDKVPRQRFVVGLTIDKTGHVSMN